MLLGACLVILVHTRMLKEAHCVSRVLQKLIVKNEGCRSVSPSPTVTRLLIARPLVGIARLFGKVPMAAALSNILTIATQILPGGSARSAPLAVRATLTQPAGPHLDRFPAGG